MQAVNQHLKHLRKTGLFGRPWLLVFDQIILLKRFSITCYGRQMTKVIQG